MKARLALATLLYMVSADVLSDRYPVFEASPGNDKSINDSFSNAYDINFETLTEI